MSDLNSKIFDLKNVLAIQGTDGNWDYDPYMHGFYNGVELCLSTLEEREVNFRDAPKQWGCEKEDTKFPTFLHED
tara:strand:- start:243 stop:467 length:225 start_codon:yes stop_codon:yes gene_type:complete